MSAPVFVDTSALYAYLDADDANHARAVESWDALLHQLDAGDGSAVTHSGVVIETAALVQRRLGMAASRALHHDLFPLLDIVWIDAGLHGRGVTAMLAADSRSVSLVDWISFDVMHTHVVDLAFAFDDDFQRQGFLSFA